ncbi:winged helix-turn-helix domain-containing protein [Streptomyces netropsis]|uniref:DNA-binding transcriptional ArsR family regulator n=1 Tax=Streptomyces netropsis TaxID=55404 RepID=A0A7W7PGE0_STRNE|nr:winged helix-turn-helix domain-containing protein [Streptomyces netropsis]MBB4888979.1 DNA-binding transcriptional ArsR family regulator [Streptomyces netropsis]GGR11172.1 transcriptional regulator [Streptomyces netropsis]
MAERERPDGPHPETHVVLDAKGLRAMAHPVRVQLVGLLRTHGPSTATRLAERLGLGSGVTSYHLRQLGTAGFVEEDTDRGNARERWWRAVHQGTWLTDKGLADREPEATMAYMRSVADSHAQRARLALDAVETMPRPWRDNLDLSDWSLRLTPEEAASLGEELRAVVNRYRRDRPDGGSGAPVGAERVVLITHLLPEPDAVAEPEGETP